MVCVFRDVCDNYRWVNGKWSWFMLIRESRDSWDFPSVLTNKQTIYSLRIIIIRDLYFVKKLQFSTYVIKFKI